MLHKFYKMQKQKALPQEVRDNFKHFNQDKMHHDIYEDGAQALANDPKPSAPSDPLGENSVKISDLVEDVAADLHKEKKGGLQALLSAQLKAQAKQKIEFTE